jgi:hypothetical protein
MRIINALVAAASLFTIPITGSAQQQWNDDCAQRTKEPLLTRGCAVLDEFMDALNARDGTKWARTLNYPHIRLAADEVAVWKNADEFQSSTDFAQFAAANQGWVRSAWDRRHLVQRSQGKLHFLVQFTRYGEADRKIASFESLYIITLKDGHWGIQARSTFAGISTRGATL